MQDVPQDPSPSLCRKKCVLSSVVTTGSLQERVGAVFGHDAVGLALLGLVLGLERVANAVVLLGEELLCFKRGDAARSCFSC